jgi:hypothetical protein
MRKLVRECGSCERENELSEPNKHEGHFLWQTFSVGKSG